MGAYKNKEEVFAALWSRARDGKINLLDIDSELYSAIRSMFPDVQNAVRRAGLMYEWIDKKELAKKFKEIWIEKKGKAPLTGWAAIIEVAPQLRYSLESYFITIGAICKVTGIPRGASLKTPQIKRIQVKKRPKPSTPKLLKLIEANSDKIFFQLVDFLPKVFTSLDIRHELLELWKGESEFVTQIGILHTYKLNAFMRIWFKKEYLIKKTGSRKYKINWEKVDELKGKLRNEQE